jgi:hypothetical protein
MLRQKACDKVLSEVSASKVVFVLAVSPEGHGVYQIKNHKEVCKTQVIAIITT